MKQLTQIKPVLSSIIILLTAVLHSTKAIADSDFLWNTVNKECVPNQKDNGLPAPCAEVTFVEKSDAGYAVFKDRTGPLQYLLLPTTKITGIESPEILQNNSPNYFYEAWKAKAHMERIYKAEISDEDISAAINSQVSRSQNQLHIHISCIRPDIKTLLRQKVLSINSSWTSFPGGILGHNYFARRITKEQLHTENMFQLLANDFPDAKINMKDFGLGLVAMKNGDNSLDYILLTDKADALTKDRGHVEDIQDHGCPQLYRKKN